MKALLTAHLVGSSPGTAASGVTCLTLGTNMDPSSITGGADPASEALAPVDGNGSAPGAIRQRPPAAEPPLGAYRRVLIVEDEATLRRILARNLASRGLLVREAATVEAAVGAVAQERPDLLLLDINLPDRTGWDVMRELRRRRTEVPTIVISAVRANSTRLEEFHPLAYLPKPFPLEALLRLVFTPADRPGQQTDNAIG